MHSDLAGTGRKHSDSDLSGTGGWYSDSYLAGTGGWYSDSDLAGTGGKYSDWARIDGLHSGLEGKAAMLLLIDVFEIILL